MRNAGQNQPHIENRSLESFELVHTQKCSECQQGNQSKAERQI